MNTAFYWVTGVNTLGREIYLVFPPNYSSVKVEQEKNKILKSYFGKLFMWLSLKVNKCNRIYQKKSFSYVSSMNAFDSIS